MFHRGPGGLPIPGRRKKRGMGLGGWLVIGGVVAFTGLGGVIVDKVGSLGGSCRSMLAQLGAPTSLCTPFGNGVQTITAAVPDVSSLTASMNFQLPGNMRQFTKQLEQLVDTDAFQAAIGPELAQYVDIDAVRQLDGAMGGTLDQALSETQKLSMALSQTALGNGMLGGQFGNADPVQATQWFEQGASMGEYGILSQLSLGNMYSSGQHTAPDFGKAEHFYGETLKSLDALQGANTREATALLNNLPMDADQLRERLEAQLRHLRR